MKLKFHSNHNICPNFKKIIIYEFLFCIVVKYNVFTCYKDEYSEILNKNNSLVCVHKSVKL